MRWHELSACVPQARPPDCRPTRGLSRTRVTVAVPLLVLACASVAALYSPLAALLLLIAAGSEAFTVSLRGARVSGSFAALVLAMALLGPVPAAAIAVGAALFDGVISCRRPHAVLGNVATYATVPLLGGWILQLVGTDDPMAFATAVVLVFMLTNALNFTAMAAYLRVSGVLSLREAFLTVYRTMLPFELATALLTAGVAFSYDRLGIAAIGLLAVVLAVFHHLAQTGAHAYERGAELARRTEELGALQVGVLSTVLQTLSMRDAMTARHSAAVARYSREVAAMLGRRRARAGPDPHRRAAARHRQVHPPRQRPLRQPQAHRRRVGADQAPPRAGRQARPEHRGLRPDRRDRPLPPRAVRRRRLPGRHRRRRRSRSAPASSPSPTPTT